MKQNVLTAGDSQSRLAETSVISDIPASASTAQTAAHRTNRLEKAQNYRGISHQHASMKKPCMQLEPLSGHSLSHRTANKLSRSMDDVTTHRSDGDSRCCRLPQLTSSSTAMLSARTEPSYSVVNSDLFALRSQLKNKPPSKPCIPLLNHKAAYNGFTRGKTEDVLLNQVRV